MSQRQGGRRRLQQQRQGHTQGIRDPAAPAELHMWLNSANLGVVFCELGGRVLWKNQMAGLMTTWDRLPADLWERDAPAHASVEAVTEGIHWWRCLVKAGVEPIGWAVWFFLQPAGGAAEARVLREAGASPREIDAYLAKVGGATSAVASERAAMSPRTLEGYLRRLYLRFAAHGFEELNARIRERVLGMGRKPPL